MAKQVNGAIYYGIGLDNKQLKTDALQSQRILQGIGDTAVSEGARIDNTFRNLAKSAGLVFGTQQVIQFGRSIVQVRGEFQKLETAFGVLLGNKAQADKLMADAVTLAATTPFGLQDVSAGAKQLLAYGFAAEDIIEDLRRLGDVSAGLGLPLERLTYLYGTTMTQGRLYTRDLMQFTTSGIPLLQALADQFSVSTSEVQKLVEAGEVGFPEVQKAIYAMTGEGGQFNNMMGELSKTIPGQIEKLKDAWQVMLNDIGKGQQGFINSIIDGAAAAVENYKPILEILKTLIVTYGAYKAAVAFTSVVQTSNANVRYNAEIQALQALVAAKKQNTNADLQQMVADKQLSSVQAERIAALRQELADQLKAAQATAADAAAKTAAAKANHAAALQAALSSKQLVAQREMELSLAKLSGDQAKIELAEKSLLEAQEKRHIAVKARKATADQLAIAQSKSATAATAANTLQQNINNASKVAAARATNIFTAAVNIGRKAMIGFSAAVKANPVGFLISGVLLAVQGISALTRSTREANEAHQEQIDSILKEQAETNRLINSLGSANASEEDRKRILEELRSVNPEIVKGIENEATAYEELSAKLTEYNNLKVSEIALKDFARNSGFNDAVKAMNDARNDVAQAGADLSNEYADVIISFQRLVNNDQIPQYIEDKISSIIESGIPQEEQMRQIADYIDGIITDANDSLANAIGLRQIPPQLRLLVKELGDIDAGDYAAKLGAMSDANAIFSQKTEEMRVRIDALVGGMGLTGEKAEATKRHLLNLFGIDPTPLSSGAEDVANKLASFGDVSEKTFADLVRDLPVVRSEFEALKKAGKLDEGQIAQWTTLIDKMKEALGIKLDAGEGTKAYWEAEAKAAEEALEAMTQAQKGSKEWNAQLARMNNANKQLETWNFKSSGRSSSSAADNTQRDAEALKKLEKYFADDVAQARIDAMEDGLEKTLAQNELNYQRELAQIKEQERELLVARKKLLSASDQKTLDALAQQMTSDYKGNVDLLARPVIDAAKLAQKGWEDAGEGIATVFSSQFGIEDASGKVREILITPILPDGSVLSPEELENYVFETLQGSKDILEADGKGIVLAIDVDPDGSAGDKLHDLQEQYYDLLSLTAEEQAGFATQRGSAATERDRENAEARKKEVERQKQEAEKLLQDYGSYLEKRAALTEQWEAKIAKTPEKYRAGARAKMTSELAALDDEYQQFSQGIENLFEHTSKKSIDELERVSARAKAIFTALKNNDYEAYLSAEGNSGNAMTREQFDVFRNSKRYMEETADGIENINRKVFESQSAFKRLGQAIKEALNGDAKKQAFADIGAALGEISDMAQVVGDSVGQIFDAFGNDEAAGIANDIAGIIGGVGQVGQGVAKIMSGDIVGGIMDGVKGIANTITSIFSLSDRTNEKHIQALQQRYDALAKQIDSIDDKIDRIRELQDKSYSTERQKNIDEETKALEEQNAKQQEQIEIIRKQIEEERDKSKTDKDRIKAWEKDIENLNKQIEENNRQIEENKERRIDAIYGQDIQQAIEDFANAYADAWTSGMPSGQSLKKQVRDMIKAQVLEMIKAAPELTEALKYLRETLLPAITADNIITPEEWAQIEEYMNGLGDKLDQKFGGLMGAFEEDVNRLASSKGIATASQDSVDELNGRITVIQGHTFSIVESVKILVANSSKILLHLAGIERNTGRLEAIEANIGAVRADLSSMKAAVNDIAVKGIKLKQ